MNKMKRIDMSEAAQQKRVDDWLALKVYMACYHCHCAAHFTSVEAASQYGYHEIADANYQGLDDEDEIVGDDEMLNWYTHIGYCPACWAEVQEPAQKSLF